MSVLATTLQLVSSAISGLAGGALIRLAYDVYRDRKRDRDDLIAAIRIVRYELTTITGCIEQRTLISEFSDSNYRSVQLLAHRLPDSIRTKLALVYAVDFSIATAKMCALVQLRRSTATTPTPTLTASMQAAFTGLPEIAARMQAVNKQLLDHLREALGAEPLNGSAPIFQNAPP